VEGGITVARVLVVDDEPFICDSLRMLLEDAGYAVMVASGGEEALRVLRAGGEACVVLLDLLMPGMDGLEMLQRVADDPVLAARHGYILMTGDSSRLLEAAARVLDTLPVTVVRKPFDIDDVLETVAAVARRVSGAEAGAAGEGALPD